MSIKTKFLAMMSMLSCFVSAAQPESYPVIDYKTCFGLSGGRYACLAVLETTSNLRGKVVEVLEYPDSIKNLPGYLPCYLSTGSIKLCISNPGAEIIILSFPESGAWPTVTIIDTNNQKTLFGMLYAHLLTMSDGKIGLFLGAGSHNKSDLQSLLNGQSLGSLLKGAKAIAEISDDLTVLAPPQVECDIISKWGGRLDIAELDDLRLIANLGYGVNPSIRDRLRRSESDGLYTKTVGDYKIHFSVSTDADSPPSIMPFKGGQRVLTVSTRLGMQSGVATAQNGPESQRVDSAFYRKELLKVLPTGHQLSTKEIEHLLQKLPEKILDLEAEL
jgi:hypothetical protein